MQNNFETIAKAFRHNTGKSFLDSGDHYGRHWEKPTITKDNPLVTIDTWQNEVTATIETARFLAETCEVDFNLQEQFEEWANKEENSELSWFDAGHTFATEVLGLTKLASDNTYNGENDLSQNYVWEVYSKNDKGDWIYDDDAILVVYAHTGCDVRGGYAYPLFLRCQGDYSIPVDLVAQFYISKGYNKNGEELTEEECRNLDEKWQCGYSSAPSYELSKEIESIMDDKNIDSVTVKLLTGEIVKIHADARIY